MQNTQGPEVLYEAAGKATAVPQSVMRLTHRTLNYLLVMLLATRAELRFVRSSLQKNRALYERSQRDLARQTQINTHMERWLRDQDQQQEQQQDQ